jgi:hypothetical protein
MNAINRRKDYNNIERICSNMTRRLRRLKESYSDINSNNAWEAYDIALDRLGAEGLALNLGKAMGREQLAKNLSYIFQAHDIPFHEDDVDESCHKRAFKESDTEISYITVKDVDTNKLAKGVAYAVNQLADDDYSTYHWVLGRDDKNIYELAVGRDAEDNICMKWAYIPKNSGMAEYDIDYIMPYDEDGVWDSETIIKQSDDMRGRVSTNDVLRDVRYLVKDFEDYVRKHNDKIEVTESRDFRNRMTHERVRTHSKCRR